MRNYRNNNHATPEMVKATKEIHRYIKLYFTKELEIQTPYVRPSFKYNLHLAQYEEDQREPYVTFNLKAMESDEVTSETIEGLRSYLEQNRPHNGFYAVGSKPAASTSARGNLIVSKDYSFHLYITFDDFDTHTLEEEEVEPSNVVNYEIDDGVGFD
jgi:hypothetical protein